jgi:hypothetical protein
MLNLLLRNVREFPVIYSLSKVESFIHSAAQLGGHQTFLYKVQIKIGKHGRVLRGPERLKNQKR